jgi:hypothetical protein
MRRVVLVAPHFIPSFLPSVHRSRLWAYHLEEFGWKPIILTTDPKYYECQISDDMLALLPEGLEVIRTKALPTKPIRPVGDIGFRSIWWYRQALDKLAKEKRIDFLHFTVPAYSPSLLGPGFTKRTGIPYGIDYIDPWIPETPRADRVFSKHWVVQRFNRVLEPIAVSRARLITGINRAYFGSVLKRNPDLRGRVVTAGMPYGGSERDYEALDRKPRSAYLFQEASALNLIYAGALLPKAFAIADRLMEGVARLKAGGSPWIRRLRLHFVGTGIKENDPHSGHTVKPFIEKHGVGDLVSEMPSRIGYLDVLNHLRRSDGILVIGSTEKHYSPSKIYQSVMAHRPVLALLHEKSTAAATLRESRAGQVVTFTGEQLPSAAQLGKALESFCVSLEGYDAERVNWEAFAKTSARESARVLAGALSQAVSRNDPEG